MAMYERVGGNQKPSFEEHMQQRRELNTLYKKVLHLQFILREASNEEADIDAKMASLVGESNSPNSLGKHSPKGKALK